jgi:outer membrane protein assembly factor BamB
VSARWTARYGGVALTLLAAASGAQPADQSTPASLVVGGAMDARWTAPLDVVAGTAPVADDSSAYVVTRAPAVVAVDLASGATRWQVDAASGVAPAVSDGLAFVVTADGVQAVHSASGAVAWRRALTPGVATPPGVDAGRLVLPLADGEVTALDPRDGTVLWRTPLGGVAHTTPASAADRWYVALADGRVVALDARSGQPLWTRDLEGRATGLLPLEDELLVGTAGSLVSLARSSGRPRWRWRLGTPVAGRPAADDRHIYVVGFDHLLRALDRRSGNLRWRRALPHRPASGPVLAGGAVLVPSLSTEIPTFAAATGTPGPAITSTSEVGSALYFLGSGRATRTRLLAVTTEGALVGFASRIEAAPAALTDLPGVPVEEPTPTQRPPAPPGPAAR